MAEGELDDPGGAAAKGNAPVTPTEAVSESSERPVTLPPIAGFWRRLAAFLLDCLVLGIAGQLIAWPLSAFWFRVGPYGRLVGLPIALLYYGLMDSRLGGGQTLGKRLLKVALRDAEAHPIGIGRSILRTLVWLLPLTLNGWALPVMTEVIVSAIAGIIVFGVGGAVTLTMIFNQRTRQGLHDMLAGTFVLHLDGRPINALPTPRRQQWILPGVTLASAVILTASVGFLVSHFVPRLEHVVKLQRRLQNERMYFSVGVSDMTTSSFGGDTSRTLGVVAWYKGVPTDDESSVVMEKLAQTVLAMDDVEQFDYINIEVASAYDLGIASGRTSHFDREPVSTWRERVGDRSRSPH